MIELLLEMGGEVVDIVDPVEIQITQEYVAVSKKYCPNKNLTSHLDQ